jgi:endogenous inhibitor of DNA gyrase (YacG/DUF329 family)
MRSVKVECEVCGEDIIRLKRKDGVYFCGRKCAMIHAGKTAVRECPICGKRFTVKMSNVEHGWGKYCSKTCANKALEVNHYKTCPQCGKTFLGDKDNWMKQKFCSKECMKEAFCNPIDKELLQKLYVEDELTTREIGQIVARSKKVVLDYLKRYGIPVRPDGIKNRKRIECTDGHLVRSYYEKAFDNLLHRNGIEHEYDPRLPFNHRYMADFKVGDVYIEIWGLMGIKRYKENRDKKIQLYRDNGCKLLEVFPDDFKSIETKLNELKSLV